MSRNRVYISRHQLNRYGFKVRQYGADVKCERFIEGEGTYIIFIYDWMCDRPDIILMIELNGERIFENVVKNRQRFQKVMKLLNIRKV